jgi:Flp pilus assembly protein TadG
MTHLSKKRRKVYCLGNCERSGVAAVEFAVVAPIFLLFVLGIIEFGRCMMVQQVITNGAREGARIAILDGSSTSAVQTMVNSHLTVAGINNAVITITPDPPSSASAGSQVSVQVSTSYSNVSWLPMTLFMNGKTLSARSTMLRETMK